MFAGVVPSHVGETINRTTNENPDLCVLLGGLRKNASLYLSGGIQGYLHLQMGHASTYQQKFLFISTHLIVLWCTDTFRANTLVSILEPEQSSPL